MVALSEQSAAYVFGGTPTELERLLAKADELEASARWLLDNIDIRPGSRVVDIGCGPMGILNLLSDRVGPHGEVIGVEREARFVETARRELTKRALSNVKVIQADALKTGLEKNSFDFVHERLVLINVPEREALLAEMVSLLRPGGTLALENNDNVSWLCHPEHPSWNILRDAFFTAFQANGGDLFLGRRLPGLLRAAGVQDVQVKVHVDVVKPGSYRRAHLFSLLDSLHDKVIALQLLSEEELANHRDALRRHLDNSDTVIIDKLHVQAWGRKAR
jgi:trans-aconitate methyltransferase